MNNFINEKIAIDRINNVKKNKLKFLDLSGLMLDKIPTDISDLYFLLEINLSFNRLNEFPKSIAQLDNLQFLNISHNYLHDINFEFGRYYSIIEIDISNNYLYFIPESLSYLNNAKIIYQNNPFLYDLPPELIEDNDLSYINYYLDALKDTDNKEKLFEVKLLIVGKGESGKTSLIKTLQNPDFILEVGKEATTHGIEIKSLSENVFFPAQKPYYNKRVDFENLYYLDENEDWDEEGLKKL